MPHKPFQIAVDGPVSAGKGTVCRLVAERLGFLYVDTGAMYRVTALLAERSNTPLTDEDALVKLVAAAEIDMRNPEGDEKDGRLTTVLINGEDVSWQIRTESISDGSSKVAQLAKIRKLLVSKQQEIASHHDVVMEGRDITYRVLPDAPLKIYLTANEMVRAKRRHLQLQTRGDSISFEEVYRDILDRDHRDIHRDTDPLKQVDEAWVIDTSDLEIDKVVDVIVGKANMLRDQFKSKAN